MCLQRARIDFFHAVKSNKAPSSLHSCEECQQRSFCLSQHKECTPSPSSSKSAQQGAFCSSISQIGQLQRLLGTGVLSPPSATGFRAPSTAQLLSLCHYPDQKVSAASSALRHRIKPHSTSESSLPSSTLTFLLLLSLQTQGFGYIGLFTVPRKRPLAFLHLPPFEVCFLHQEYIYLPPASLEIISGKCTLIIASPVFKKLFEEPKHASTFQIGLTFSFNALICNLFISFIPLILS